MPNDLPVALNNLLRRYRACLGIQLLRQLLLSEVVLDAHPAIIHSSLFLHWSYKHFGETMLIN